MDTVPNCLQHHHKTLVPDPLTYHQPLSETLD